ncbi:MAG: 50S ribosomal protein L30 [Solitalea-like symbiont of Acarus siro]
MTKVTVSLKRSLIRRPESQRKVVYSLGLTSKINSKATVAITTASLGMIKKVFHLISINKI